jgi:hypothetical protein
MSAWTKIDSDTFIIERTQIIILRKIKLSQLRERLTTLETKLNQIPTFNEIKIECLTSKNVEEFLRTAEKYNLYLTLSSEIQDIKKLIKQLGTL